jgi:hypothetical protein
VFDKTYGGRAKMENALVSIFGGTRSSEIIALLTDTTNPDTGDDIEPVLSDVPDNQSAEWGTW